jgi:hypothetical protein
MVQPIDYNLNVLSPMQRFTEGLKFGEDLLTARLARDETQQLMGMRAAQEARAVTAEQERRAAAEAERARAEKMQADLGGLVALAEGGNLTTDAINQFRLTYAKTLDDVTNVFTSMEQERQKPLKDFGVKSVTLALTGNAAAAEALYQERIDAAKNAGTPEAMQEAQALEAELATLKANPINFATAQATLLRHADYINDEQLKGLLDLAKQGKPGTADVQKAENIGGIAVVTTLTDGTVQIKDARTNEVVTGPAADKLLEEASDIQARMAGAKSGAAEEAKLIAGINFGRLAAAETEMGAQAVKLGIDAFAQLGLVNANIANLDRAIQLVEEEGANTGVIANKLPSWSDATIELKNMQNTLGLDVIGATTFGALSESELDLALQTALPTNLREEALANWLRAKKAAQKKVAGYLTQKAEFFSTGRGPDQWLAFVSSGETDVNKWMRKNPLGRGAAAPTTAAPTGEGLRAEDLQYLEGN